MKKRQRKKNAKKWCDFYRIPYKNKYAKKNASALLYGKDYVGSTFVRLVELNDGFDPKKGGWALTID